MSFEPGDIRAVEAGRKGGATRRHPRAKVGDRFGDRTVVKLLPRDRTANERVRVQCGRGHAVAAYVFNLRKHPHCPECRKLAKAEELASYYAGEVSRLGGKR